MALAELLAALGTEAGYRSAISRAYYACHLFARDRMFGLDAVLWLTSPHRPSHYAVIEALRQRVDDRGPDALDDLKRMREVADYVRDDEHPEVQRLFTPHCVSEWEGLTGRALPLARATFAALEEALPAAP